MKSTKSILILFIINCFQFCLFSQNLGIDHMSEYTHLLRNKNVGVVLDGFLFATDDFCHEQHFNNNSVITVCDKVLQEKIDEKLSS